MANRHTHTHMYIEALTHTRVYRGTHTHTRTHAYIEAVAGINKFISIKVTFN